MLYFFRHHTKNLIKEPIKSGKKMYRTFTKISFSAMALLALTGCTTKNLTVQKIEKGSNIIAMNTSASLVDNNIKVGNDINYEAMYADQKCYDESYYRGIGTNYLKVLFGLESHFSSNRIDSTGRVMFWIAAPVALPIFAGFEVLFLQPFWDYGYEHKCDVSATKKDDPKNEIDFGRFSGTIKVQNGDTKQIKEFKWNNEPFPLKLLLEDENDMISASKHAITNAHSYTVEIDGMYTASPSSTPIPLKLSKEIKQ